MAYEIKKAAVLGAGVMGSGIAAHLANVGIPCYLLDIVPFDNMLSEKEIAKKATDKKVRNKLADQALKQAIKDLAGRETCIWLTIQGGKPSTDEYDDQAVAVV